MVSPLVNANNDTGRQGNTWVYRKYTPFQEILKHKIDRYIVQ